MTKKCTGCGKETDLVMGLGPVLLCKAECYPDAIIARDEIQGNGGSFDITVWARRRYNRLHDTTTSTERVNRRNDELNAMAQELGFDSLSQMLTDWKNHKIKIIVETTDRLTDYGRNDPAEAQK